MGRRAGTTAEVTRHELLAAAVQALARSGYEGARVADIARSAGLSPAAIYHHFPSRTDLLDAAMAEVAPDLLAELLEAGRTGSVIGAFRAVGSGLTSRDETVGPLLLEFVLTAARDHSVAGAVSAMFATHEQAAADLVRSGQERGEVDADLDADALTRLTFLLAMGSLVAGTLEMPPVDQDAWEAVVDRLLDAVRPPDPPDAPESPDPPDPTRSPRP